MAAPGCGCPCGCFGCGCILPLVLLLAAGGVVAVLAIAPLFGLGPSF